VRAPAAALALVLASLAALAAGCGGGGDDAPKWASAGSAKIRPGVQTRTKGGQCTANFVFYEGDEVYLGQAAHCSSTGKANGTNGCRTGSRPLGTPVTIQGASRPGKLAYNSWLTMQKEGETNKEACSFNDLALVRIDPADRDKVNPSIPKFGGPTGLGAVSKGQEVFTYGNSELRLGIDFLKPKSGVVFATSPGGWSHNVYTLTPGIPGDSGSGFVNRSGEAFGILSTLQFLGKPLSNGVGDLGKELDYARSHGFDDLKLAEGTEKFQRTGLFGIG
jgi:hypothetical protein